MLFILILVIDYQFFLRELIMHLLMKMQYAYLFVTSHPTMHLSQITILKVHFPMTCLWIPCNKSIY